MPSVFSHFSRLACAAIAVALLAIASGCGEDTDSSPQQESAGGNKTDQAFLQAMVPHHESAVEMAQVAIEKGEHTEVQNLGRSIVKAQSEEIAQMGKLHMEIFGSELAPDEMAAERMGLSMEEAGMHGGASAGANKVDEGRIVDKAFIDGMIPHHQGAIMMARAEQEKGENPEIKKLAAAIIAAQTREIEQMNSWREKWYGAESGGMGPQPHGGAHE